MTICALAVGGSIASSGLGAHPDRRLWRASNSLLTANGRGALRVLIGPTGKPVLGRDRKPLRVAANGTLIDSRGRPALGRTGHPLKLGAHATVPLQALTPTARRRSAAHRPHRTRHAKAPAGQHPAGAEAAGPPVVVGVFYQDPGGNDRGYASFGMTIQASDAGQVAQATADYVNARGGIGGRRLVLRLEKVNFWDGRPFDVTERDACDALTAGTPAPVAVIGGGRPSLISCLSQHGVPHLTDYPGLAASPVFAQRPDLFTPGSVPVDLTLGPYIAGLKAHGFFAGNARVGVLRGEYLADNDVIEQALSNALANNGVHPVATATWSLPSGVTGLPAAIVRFEDAELRFRLAGVNRLVIIDGLGLVSALFGRFAEAQAYRPVYGLSSTTIPAAGLTPRAQLHGAVGIGWSPLTDVGPEQEGSVPPARAECEAILSAAGVSSGDRYELGQYTAIADCDALLLLRDLYAGRKDTSAAAMRAAIETLGSSRTAAVDMASLLSAARHYGANGYRVLRFDDRCACPVYSGPLQPFG